jgi:hypothetical protein
MKYEKKFLSREEQASETHLQSQSHQEIHEFATPEDALRFDIKQTPMPDVITQRLSRSLKHQPKRPWWKRWFA